MLCHGVLCIFLTTLLPSAAVAFYFCQYEKLLRYGKLATSYKYAGETCSGSLSIRDSIARTIQGTNILPTPTF